MFVKAWLSACCAHLAPQEDLLSTSFASGASPLRRLFLQRGNDMESARVNHHFTREGGEEASA